MTARAHEVGRLADLAPDGMTEVEIGSTAVLLIRRGDEVTALAARCPHYGAPLAEGVLAGDRIVGRERALKRQFALPRIIHPETHRLITS
jgi:nitrite reductase/ring-hydroxylating ferredoxin subunit